MSKLNNNSIGKRIIEILKERDMKQIALANLLNISHSHVSNIIHGRTVPSPRVLQDLSDKLNVNLNWLETGYGDKFKKTSDIDSDYVIKKFNELSDNSKQVILKVLETFVRVEYLDKL